MMAVIFELIPKQAKAQTYLDAAAALLPLLDQIDGFISIERFQSLSDPTKMLSLSYWRDEAAVLEWRTLEAHRDTQSLGRLQLFADYRLCVASVVRDYGMLSRLQAPTDSRAAHE